MAQTKTLFFTCQSSTSSLMDFLKRSATTKKNRNKEKEIIKFITFTRADKS
ncbi:MAG: hypothetical protein ABIY62_09015 [Ginsengibacter sp.]